MDYQRIVYSQNPIASRSHLPLKRLRTTVPKPIVGVLSRKHNVSNFGMSLPGYPGTFQLKRGTPVHLICLESVASDLRIP